MPLESLSSIEDQPQARALLPIDSSAILTSILQRQALRREAHLPLLNIRAEYERAVQQARWLAHVEEHGETVRAQVLAELRFRHGPQFGYSVGGLWTVWLRTEKRLREMFTRDA